MYDLIQSTFAMLHNNINFESFCSDVVCVPSRYKLLKSQNQGNKTNLIKQYLKSFTYKYESRHMIKSEFHSDTIKSLGQYRDFMVMV